MPRRVLHKAHARLRWGTAFLASVVLVTVLVNWLMGLLLIEFILLFGIFRGMLGRRRPLGEIDCRVSAVASPQQLAGNGYLPAFERLEDEAGGSP